jgi:hypothetical protein
MYSFDEEMVIAGDIFEVHGPFAPLFRLIWEKGVRADMRLTFTALETEARRLEQARA